MKTLKVQIEEPVATRLAEIAGKLGLTQEELVRQSLEEKLARIEDGFAIAAECVVSKDEALYRRLA